MDRAGRRLRLVNVPNSNPPRPMINTRPLWQFMNNRFFVGSQQAQMDHQGRMARPSFIKRHGKQCWRCSELVPQARQSDRWDVHRWMVSQSCPLSASANTNLQFIYWLSKHIQLLALLWVLLATIGGVTEKAKRFVCSCSYTLVGDMTQRCQEGPLMLKGRGL